MSMHVAVLKGGLSAERDVSLSSGAAIEKALTELGHKVTAVDAGRDLAQQLAKVKPDVVFNGLHGQYGEDGCTQGMLEILGIPYTHSGVLASALAMDKPMAKKVFQACGLRCPDGDVYTLGEIIEHKPVAMPFVIKPTNEGSSVDVRIIFQEDDLASLHNLDQSMTMLVETYIPGREIQVAVLNDQALGAIEIRPHEGFYDYAAKYTDGKAEHLMPAPLEPKDYEEVCELAVRAHKALGCRGLTRSDFRYNDEALGEGVFYLLEVNTQPGMTPLSLAPEIAAHQGISFNQLVAQLIETARSDHHG